MGWFHTLLQAYGFPVKAPKIPLAAVQHLVINNVAEPPSLDPHKSTGSLEQKIMRDLLEGLFILDRHGEVVPGIALYAYSANKKTWSFHLRPGTQWSNGDSLNAYDFVYSWRRLADPKTASPWAAILQSMKIANIEAILAGKLPPEALGIKALGPLTLQITLSQPLGFLKKMLLDSSLLPVHQATIEQHGENWTRAENWVGNGAYCLKERVVNEKIVLIRNHNYWDNSQTIIDQVTYLPLNEEAELAGYRSGTIDITRSNIPTTQYQKLASEFPKELQRFPKPAINGFQLNTKKPPFNDVRVRQALNLALNRKLIAQQLSIPERYIAYNIVPNGLGGLTAYQPYWLSWSDEQRLQTAQKLLREAGYGPHHPLRFTVLHLTTETQKQLSLIVSTLWRANLGAEITLINREWKTLLEEMSLGNFQAAHSVKLTVYEEPYALLADYLSYDCSNETGYNNPAFDHLLAKSLDSLYAADRYPLYHQAEAILAEGVPVIPLFHHATLRLVKPYVGGLSSRNKMNLFYTKDLYITQHPLAPQKARQ